MVAAAPESQPAAPPAETTPAPSIRLRQELRLLPADPDPDGTPAWVLHDPLAGRYYRLGPREVEILASIEAGDADAVAERVRAETEREVDADDVEAVVAFLRRYNLVIADSRQQEWYRQQRERTPKLFERLSRSYLFVRIPLTRPDRFLERTLPWVRWLGAPATKAALGLCGLVGLYLASRQLDLFVATFLHFFDLAGLLAYAAVISGVKILHELGHAYAAKARGCRVPTIGVAFLVFWPVLYTDTTEAWSLASRRERRAISAAGIQVELGIAALALLAWSLLPPGMAKSACFLLATTTWLISLLVNMNPFMRFDGYYVLSDWMGIPNLEARGTALTRWWLRERLFAFGDAPPEPPRRGLVAYGLGLWTYRFFLFLSIALIVYHFFIKVLGVFLFAVQIGYFLVRPMAGEIREWAARWREMRPSRTLLRTALLLTVGLSLLLVPWRGTVLAPATLKGRYQPLYTAEAGRIERLAVANGDRVEAGDLLVKIHVPELEHELEMARQRLRQLRWQREAGGLHRELLSRKLVIDTELHTQLRRVRGLERKRARLALVAPHGGVVVDRAPAFREGDWVPADTPLLAVLDRSEPRLTAYVTESDLGRIAPGDRGRFHPEAGAWPPFPVEIESIDRVDLTRLDDPYPASLFGGELAVRRSSRDELVPVEATYRVRLRGAAEAGLPPRVVRGRVAIAGERKSLAGRIVQSGLGLLRREAGF